MDTEFLPALVALGLGLLGGIGLLLKARSGERLPEPVVAERLELERQRDGLYEQLRSLELESTKMPTAIYQEERQRLEVEAARLLLALDRLGVGTGLKPSERIAERHPQLVGAIWGAAIVAFLAATWFGLDRYSNPRGAGGSLTGNSQSGDDPSQEAAAKAEDAAQAAEVARLEVIAAAKPDDIPAQNAYAHALIRVNKMMEAWRISEAIVAREDGNVEARTHQAIVLLGIGETEMAVGVLDKVLQGAPEFTEALAYRGLLYMRAGDKEKAVAMWEKTITLDPSQEPMLRPLINMVNKGNLPGGPTPPSATVAEGPSISGEIQIDPALVASIPPGTVLFVLARPPGVTRGPPMAVKKLPAQDFPIKFSLGPKDNPMGGGLSGSVVITARLDWDGSSSTHAPDEPQGQSATVEPGASGLVITLAVP